MREGVLDLLEVWSKRDNLAGEGHLLEVLITLLVLPEQAVEFDEDSLLLFSGVDFFPPDLMKDIEYNHREEGDSIDEKSRHVEPVIEPVRLIHGRVLIPHC